MYDNPPYHFQTNTPKAAIDDFDKAIKIAEMSVDQGKAMACLAKLIEVSNN